MLQVLRPVVPIDEANVATPIWMMRQAGRYGPKYKRTQSESRFVSGFCYSPKFATEVTLQPIRPGLDFDAGYSISDYVWWFLIALDGG